MCGGFLQVADELMGCKVWDAKSGQTGAVLRDFMWRVE